MDRDQVASEIGTWAQDLYNLHDSVWDMESLGTFLEGMTMWEAADANDWTDMDLREKYGDDIEAVKEGLTIEIGLLIAELIANLQA